MTLTVQSISCGYYGIIILILGLRFAFVICVFRLLSCILISRAMRREYAWSWLLEHFGSRVVDGIPRTAPFLLVFLLLARRKTVERPGHVLDLKAVVRLHLDAVIDRWVAECGLGQLQVQPAVWRTKMAGLGCVCPFAALPPGQAGTPPTASGHNVLVLS
jgi:hypothetical protein